jgi:hypothetical protein
MKKLFLSAAIILGGLSTHAATVNPDALKIETSIQNDFTLIDSADLPAAVILALEDSYPGYVLDAAYINEYGEYKLDIRIDTATGTFYIDEEGNWLKI